ncbi:putative wd domain-containing protein [Phaeomoniella chlamydospora]|uniref:Putative wd domain-containing protein n=1 Tax=Phaeomoniella chlamydospora TaxID=158046 RepID=A0A0G2F0T4_PHACM|nr:putative wd domain-containing protein [Phaeomoniella chlamydospora]
MGLLDLGYNGAAATLSQESGYELETPAVTAFREAILDGQWPEAEGILLSSHHVDVPNEMQVNEGGALLLAAGADIGQMLFFIRQQKFLELLDQRELGMALMVLRQELTPLNHDIHQLHALSSLLMCPAEDLRTQAGWGTSITQSRQDLLSELTKSVSPSVMIPEHRLATLLDQVQRNQINECLYHNTAIVPSLYSDHHCDRENFPLKTLVELDHHTDEVWFLDFSHNGSKLATTSKDKTVVVYETTTFTVLHKLKGHGGEVSFVSWSPDDSKLISCSHDPKARIWDVESGQCILTLDHGQQPISSAAWLPDGRTFITGSLEKVNHICHWSIDANNFGAKLDTWDGDYRVQHCIITPDGSRLVVITTSKRVYVYDFRTKREMYNLSLGVELTCISVSRDSRTMLINTSSNEVLLIDIETSEQIRRFEGQRQGQFVIRSCFGGAAENFVVSGSEDSKVYVWHKENGMLIETLRGHGSGCVNAVSWNPTDPGMFASAGDDGRVRM